MEKGEFPSPPENEREKERISAEVVSGFNEKTLAEVAEVEKAAFPELMQNSEEEIKEMLEDPAHLHVIIRGADRKIVGCISGAPSETDAEELSAYDKRFQPAKDTLYVESIAFLPASRDLRTVLSGTRAFMEEAGRRGFKKLAMHARVENRLSEVLQKRYHAKNLRRLENWYDLGEPFDYLEMDIESPEETSKKD